VRRYGISLVSEPLEPTGIGTYAIQLARRLGPLLEADERAVLLAHRRFPLEVEPHPRVVERRLRFPVRRSAFRRLFEQALVPLAALRARLRVLHSLNNVVPALARGPHVVTIQDTRLFEARASRGPVVRAYRGLLYPHAVRRAARIICASRAIADDVARAFGLDAADLERRLRVVPFGVDEGFFAAPSPAALAAARGALGLAADERRPVLLFVGSFEPNKNLVRLVEAFARARKGGLEVLLVLAGGGGADRPRVLEAVERSGAGDAVRAPGYLARAHLAAAYAAARAFVFPSLLEGFGLPVLEAFAAGTPVLASDIPVLREVAGGAALHVAPSDGGALADALVRIASDDALREGLVERGLARARALSWDACARATLEVYREVA